MPSINPEYTPIQPELSDPDESDRYQPAQNHKRWPGTTYSINLLLVIALFVSVMTNLVLSLLHWPLQELKLQGKDATRYGMGTAMVLGRHCSLRKPASRRRLQLPIPSRRPIR